MKYFKLFESFVNEAKTVTLKDLDFNKFDKILKLVTTPLTTDTLDTEEYEGYEGSTISGYKKVKEIEYIAKFLKKFSELYKTGDNADFKKALDLLSDNTDTLFAICDDDDSAEMLKDKKLAKSLTDVNDVISSLGYSVYEIEPALVADHYNKLASAIDKAKI
jgi:RNA binding exosome subunit